MLASDPTDAEGLRLIRMNDVNSKGVEASFQGEVTPYLSVIVTVPKCKLVDKEGQQKDHVRHRSPNLTTEL